MAEGEVLKKVSASTLALVSLSVARVSWLVVLSNTVRSGIQVLELSVGSSFRYLLAIYMSLIDTSLSQLIQ